MPRPRVWQGEEALDMNGGDRVSILFAGTSLITATQTNAAA